MGRPRKNPVAEEVKEAKTESVKAEEAPRIAIEVAEPVEVAETAPAPEENKTFSKEQVDEMVQKAVQEAVARAMAESQRPQIVRIANDTERVHFLWNAEVSEYNVVEFGENGLYGKVTGKTGTFFVPKSELSRVLTQQVRGFLDKRWLIVVSGLDEAERETLGVNYKEGEILPKNAFASIAELPAEEMEAIFPDLCKGHKELVAQRYADTYFAGNLRHNREHIVRLNELSKSEENPKGMFLPVIKAMNTVDEG